MAVSISGDGAVTGVASINTDVSSTELGYLDGVTSAIQPQIAGAGGLVLVGQSSFSAASSVSLDNIFSTNHDNYRLMMYLDASTTVSVYARYRASGTDDTSGVNSWRRLYYDSSVVGSSSSSQNQMDIGVIRTGSPSQIVMDLSSPALAQEKVWTVLNREDGSARYIAGLSALNSAFDGMTFYPNTGTITGTIRVYGYAQ